MPGKRDNRLALLNMPVLHDSLQTSSRSTKPWQGTLMGPLPCTSRFCNHLYIISACSSQAGNVMLASICRRIGKLLLVRARHNFPGRGFSFLEGWALYRFR